MIKSFKDLDVYRLSYELAMEIFQLSREFPKEEIYSLTSQVVRSSRSIPANISEGRAKREYENVFRQHLIHSLGSASETETWLDFAKDCGYLQEQRHNELVEKLNSSGKMLNNLHRKWTKILNKGAGGWKLETGGWKLEVGNWRLEVGGWRLEAGRGILEAGGWRLEVGFWEKLLLLVLLTFGFQLLTSFEVKAQEPLQSYLTEASANNPGLQAQYTAFEASLEKAAQVSGLPNPTLSFGYFIQPVETRVGPQRARFSLNQMFPWFGSLSAKGDAAAARAQAQYLQFIDAREKLSTEVKTSYYQLWEINEMLELERENLRILESYENLATTRVRSGSGKLSSVYRVQMQIEESKTKIKILEDQILPLTRSFNRLLNRKADATVNISDTIEAPLDIRITDSVSQHPSVMQLQEMRASAEFQASAASKSGLPSFGLGLDYVLVDERPDMTLPDNGKDVIMPMVSVSLPIWRKQYSAARREAELQQKQYGLQANEAANGLNSKQDMSLFKIQQARDEMRLYNEEIVLARKTLELTISDYTNDREDFEEILRLQQKIVQYQKQRVKAYADYLAQLATLEYLTYQSTDDF